MGSEPEPAQCMVWGERHFARTGPPTSTGRAGPDQSTDTWPLVLTGTSRLSAPRLKGRHSRIPTVCLEEHKAAWQTQVSEKVIKPERRREQGCQSEGPESHPSRWCAGLCPDLVLFRTVYQQDVYILRTIPYASYVHTHTRFNGKKGGGGRQRRQVPSKQ